MGINKQEPSNLTNPKSSYLDAEINYNDSIFQDFQDSHEY